MPNAASDDSGNYTCVAVSADEKDGEAVIGYRSFHVDVVTRIVGHAPIIEKGQPGNHSAVVGEDVRLTCELAIVDHTSPPQVSWVRHFKRNGSYFAADGSINMQMLQSCSLNGMCTLNGDSEQTYIVDDPQVSI